MAAPDAPGGNLRLDAPWMPPPRLPKFSGELGDGPVVDFIAEAQRIIAAYDLEGQLAVELLLKHLDGQARREVLAQAPAARAIAGDVLGLLREAFGDQRPLTQLLTAFHCRQQRPAETVLEFSHSLQVLATRITSRDPDTRSARSLPDRFCEGLAEMALKRELRRMARENAVITLAVLRQEALHWVREESPVDTVHVQQMKTDSSQMALLKTQMATMTEAMRAMHGGSRSLGIHHSPPHDNIAGKMLPVPKDRAHGPALPEGTRPRGKLEGFNIIK